MLSVMLIQKDEQLRKQVIVSSVRVCEKTHTPKRPSHVFSGPVGWKMFPEPRHLLRVSVFSLSSRLQRRGRGGGGSKTPAFPTARALCPDLKQTGDVAAGQPPSSALTLVSARRHLLRRRRCV